MDLDVIHGRQAQNKCKDVVSTAVDLRLGRKRILHKQEVKGCLSLALDSRAKSGVFTALHTWQQYASALKAQQTEVCTLQGCEQSCCFLLCCNASFIHYL